MRLARVRGPRPKSSNTPAPSASMRQALPAEPLARAVNRAAIQTSSVLRRAPRLHFDDAVQGKGSWAENGEGRRDQNEHVVVFVTALELVALHQSEALFARHRHD